MSSAAAALAPRILDIVPPEIWAAIFGSSHTCNELEGRTIYKTKTSIFVTASQVCSHWRKIALETKVLWSYIYLEEWGRWQYPDPKLVQLWLERSGNALLSVELSFRTVDRPVRDEHFACMREIIQQSSRWKAASLNITLLSWSDQQWRTVRHLLASNKSVSLKSLRVVLIYDDYNPSRDKELPSALWADAPALKRLSLQIIENASRREPDTTSSVCHWTLQSKIPYAQITDLRLSASNVENVAWDTISTIFRATRNLISCFLAGVRKSREPAFEGALVVLRHLRYLHIATPRGPARGRNVWKLPGQLHLVLVAPVLEVLSFSECTVWDQDSFDLFITQSSPPNLNELHFVETRLHRPELLQCLRLCPTLKNLYIRDAFVLQDPDVLHALGSLVGAGDQFDLIPQLQQLSLSSTEAMKWGPEHISALIENVLKPRLSLPPGVPSSRSFSTLSIPSRGKESLQWVKGLEGVRGSPWNLKVVSDDHSVASQRLWGAP